MGTESIQYRKNCVQKVLGTESIRYKQYWVEKVLDTKYKVQKVLGTVRSFGATGSPGLLS